MNVDLFIDLGTTAIKFACYYKNRLELEMEKCIKTYIEGANHYQKTDEIISILKDVIKKISNLENYKIKTIYFSTAMHSLIPHRNESSEKVYIWSDNQASEVIENLKKNQLLTDFFYDNTGTPIHSMSPFAKILYFKQNKKDTIFKSVNKWVGIKEYLMFEFCGIWGTDISSACATGLYNSKIMEWDTKVLDFLEIDDTYFVKVFPVNQLFSIKSEIIKELNLSVDAKVIIGSTDGCLSAYGAYIFGASNMTISIGTSAAVRGVVKERIVNKEVKNFCYAFDEELWVVGGASNNGGKVLEWLSQLIYYDKNTIHKKLEEAIINSPIGAKKLLFLPYILGERAPFWSESLTGSFLGLRIEHNQSDLIRSVLEGIIFNLKYIYETLEFKEKPEYICLSGGVFKHTVVEQMVADIFEVPCLRTIYSEPISGLLALRNETMEVRCNKEMMCYPNLDKSKLYDISYEKFKESLVNIY